MRTLSGFVYVLMHPGRVPLVTWLVGVLAVMVLGGFVVGLAIGGVQMAIHASDPPHYWCQNYTATNQPEHGCQKNGDLNP
jgi:hypothetical protein